MATLMLRLAAPMQSWGCDSKFEVRRSLNFPTKSGVIGMIAAAMGYSREDSESLEELNKLKFGVRVDREGELLRDYHTAQNGRIKYPPTNRYYLCDAIFLVGLESDDIDLISKIEQALKTPAFPLFLGRRSCPPTMPLVLGKRETDLIESLESEPWLLEEWRQKRIYNDYERRLRIIVDADMNENNASILKDVPISFSKKQRKFGWRKVKDCGYITVGKTEAALFDEVVPTDHDAMNDLG
jgi:CRISPR system Cascade subunit CasD